MNRSIDTFACPNCGEEVRVGSPSCPQCGSDDETGWSEEARYDGLDLPDDAFEASRTTEKSGVLSHPVWQILAAVMLAIFLFYVFI